MESSLFLADLLTGDEPGRARRPWRAGGGGRGTARPACSRFTASPWPRPWTWVGPAGLSRLTSAATGVTKWLAGASPRRVGVVLALGWVLATQGLAAAAPASEPLGWRLGAAAWSFNRFTFLEAIEKTATLGLRYLEAFEGQRVAPDDDAKLDMNISDSVLQRIRERLVASEVTLTGIYIHELPGEEAACRRAFEFARKLGVETIISEPKPESLDLIERLCGEFNLQVALHNHPQGSSRYWHPREVLKALEGRGARLGACADVGHWQRSGIQPVEGVRLLGSRLMSLHVKDLNVAGPDGHDVPWGTGQGDIEGLLREVRQLGVTPTLFAIEYEHDWDNNSPPIAACAAFFQKTVSKLAAASSSPGPPDRNPAGTSFRGGAHQVDISPEKLPVIVNAMFTERTADKVVDRLFAKALALDDGETRVVLCVVDTCMMPRDLIDRAKTMASAATGVPVGRLLVSATHTHSAPSAMGCLGSRVDPDYAAALPAKVAAAIEGAVRNLAPARIGWAVVDDWEHTFNRRWIRRPDRLLTDPFGQPSVRAHMHPGHESSDAVGPSGPVDPGLSVLAVRSLEGRPLAVFANYSQHYYDSPLLSSDYYGRFAQHLARRLGVEAGSPPFVGIMSQGTSGDLMWMDYGSPRRDIGYDAYAREMVGRALEVYEAMVWHEWVPLRTAEATLALRYRVPSPERLAWAREMAQKVGERLPQTLPEIYAGEAIHLDARRQTELKLQALRVGGLGIAAMPNEVFAITGLKLKAQSPLQPTFNIGLANGAEGYIPPPEQHKLGGYTTWPARTAGLEVEAEPRIVETVLRLLEEVAGKPRRAIALEDGPYAEAVLRSRPLAYWRLEEMTVPLAHDASGQSRAARYEDGVALFLPGAGSGEGRLPQPTLGASRFSGTVINRAAHFAGGRLRAPAVPLGEHYTIELWLWNGLPTDARPVTGYLYSRGQDGDRDAAGEHLGIGGTHDPGRTGRLIVFNGNGRNEVLVGRTPLGLRRWHHVVLVRTGPEVTVYLDGQRELQAELETSLPPGGGGLFFGGRCDNIANLEGKLDEVAVYSRSLASEEVLAHYEAAGMTR